MIERIVLLKLVAEEASPEGRGAVATRSQHLLEALPGVLEVRVGTAGEDRTASDWDLSLVLRFASLEDVEAFRVHPEHRSYVDEYLKPRLAAIRAWNFEVVG